MKSIKVEGTVTPGKIFAVLVLAAGTKMALALENPWVALATVIGVLALYGVRKNIVKEMIKISGHVRSTNK